MIIKNIGIVIIFLTICVSFWFLALDLNQVVENDFLAQRVFGITILAIISYIPYFLLHRYVDKVKFLEIILITSIIFSVLNVYFLVDLIFNSENSLGIFGLLMYECLFVFVVVIFLVIDKSFRMCSIDSGICVQIKRHIYRKFSAIGVRYEKKT
ncbi:MAG: hypothetical protein ACKUBY_01185 [Candidatus Moraniibacteriota bacterium]